MRFKQRGVMIVEFVILLPIILLLLFSTIYFGMLLHDVNTINSVSREAARFGVVGNNYTNVANLAQARANNLLTGLYRVAPADITIQDSEDVDLANERVLDVRITARIVPTESMQILNGLLPRSLTGHTRMRIEIEQQQNNNPTN